MLLTRFRRDDPVKISEFTNAHSLGEFWCIRIHINDTLIYLFFLTVLAQFKTCLCVCDS